MAQKYNANNDSWKWGAAVGLGIAAGFGIGYLINERVNRPKIQRQEQEIGRLNVELSNAMTRIDQLQITIQTQEGHIISLRNYIDALVGRIAGLENNLDDIIAEISNVRNQLKEKVNNDEVDKVLAALLEKAKRHKAELVTSQIDYTPYS